MVESTCEAPAVFPALFHLTFMRRLGDKGQPKSTSQRFISTYNASPHGRGAQRIRRLLSFPMTSRGRASEKGLEVHLLRRRPRKLRFLSG